MNVRPYREWTPVIGRGAWIDPAATVIGRVAPWVPRPNFTVSVNDGPAILFVNVAALFIDALSGDDDIVVRTPAPNGVEWDVDVTIVGGSPSAPTGAEKSTARR